MDDENIKHWVGSEEPTQSNPLSFKYKEDRALADFYQHILNTYNQHYAGKNNVQVQDLIIATGHAESFYIGNIAKYALRYGRKGGKRNNEDLLKAAHYLCLLYALNHVTGD
jgi:DUF1365 family protein